MAASPKSSALARVRRSARQARESYERRDAAIRDAAAVASLREIAEAAGLSIPRVGQITLDRKGGDSES